VRGQAVGAAMSDFPRMPTVLSGFLVDVRNLLEARMKITTYNYPARLLSSRAFGRLPQPVYSDRGEQTPSGNQVPILGPWKA